MSVQTVATGSETSSKMSARTRDRLLSVISPLALLGLWEFCARFGFIDTRFFPAPSSVVSTMVEMMRTGELVTHTAVSMQRLLYGAILGGVPALVLGIAMGLNRPIRALFDPLIAATYPVPKSAILPLALLIFGLGEGSKIFMVAIGVFFPVVINATTGVLEINKIYLDVGQNYKAAGCVAGDHDGLQARNRHRARSDRRGGNGGRQKRARIPDLERLEHVRGRANVCRSVRDRDHRISDLARPQRTRAGHHPVEGRVTIQRYRARIRPLPA